MEIAIKIAATLLTGFIGLICMVSMVGGRLNDKEFKAIVFLFMIVLVDLLAVWA